MAKVLMNIRLEEDTKTRYEYAARIHARGNLTAWVENTLNAASSQPPKGWKKKGKK